MALISNKLCTGFLKGLPYLTRIVVAFSITLLIMLMYVYIQLDGQKNTDIKPFNSRNPIELLSVGPYSLHISLQSTTIINKSSAFRLQKIFNPHLSSGQFQRLYEGELCPNVPEEGLTNKLCDCFPKDLKGNISITFSAKSFTWNTIESHIRQSQDENGGHWSPTKCIARHRVILIIPYRNREEQLKVFLYHIQPLLKRQQLDYRIVLVEQEPGKIFNKGAMMNIGFIEAFRRFKADCVVFHDVDMLPENDLNIYGCHATPLHLSTYCSKWDYQMAYYSLIGGALSMQPSHFVLANGYSNEFFGWGGEDDDMFRRLMSKNMTALRFPKSVSRYFMMPHGRERGNFPLDNKQGGLGLIYRPEVYQTNGLNSVNNLNYTTALRFRPLYTHVLVSIDGPNIKN